MSPEEERMGKKLNPGRAGPSASHRASPEEELPPSLKSLEAELASLAPRADRLDRDRIMFLAGQMSVAGRAAGWSGWHSYLAWPAAGAMTAVAAALLVILFVRPEPRVIERIRIVKVPVSEAETPPPKTEQDDSLSVPRQLAPERPFRRATLASGRADWLPYPDWSRFRSRALELEMLDRMLAEGVDPWTHPGRRPTEEVESAAAPTSYRQLLDTLLDGKARTEPPGHWLSIPLHSGANS